MAFTIIIPVKDDERLFSLLDQLAHSPQRGEFKTLISCNGSSEDFVRRVEQKLEELPLSRALVSAEPGPSKAINYASRFVDTEKFLILDSDCVLSENFIPALLSNESADVTRGHIVYRGSTPFSKLTADWRQALNERIEKEGRLYTPALMIRKDLFHALGGFSETIRFSYDSDFSDRAMKKGHRATIVNDAVLYHDCHTSMKTEMKIWKSYGNGRYKRMSTHWSDMNLPSRLGKAVFGDLPVQQMKKSLPHMAYAFLYASVRFTGFLEGAASPEAHIGQ